jgi:hypothetical protein
LPPHVLRRVTRDSEMRRVAARRSRSTQPPMSQGEVRAEVSDAAATITLCGEFDLSNVRRVERSRTEQVGAGVRNLCLNVREVTFVVRRC